MTGSRAIVAGLLLTLAAAGCDSGSPGGGSDSLTDTQVRTFGNDLGYARPADAPALARLAIERGSDRGYDVLAATDVVADGPLDVSKTLVLRVSSHDAGSFGEQVCYRLAINSYALVGAPERIACPADATPYVPPPAPPEVVIPVGAERLVRDALRTDDTPGELRRRLDRGIARALRGRHASPPLVRVAADASGTGIGVYGGPGACLLGRSIAGKVEVWYLDPTQAQPGELSCDPPTALGGLGQQAPH